MIIKIIITVIGVVASGILGRMGGASGFHTLFRDIGVSLVTCGLVGLWGGFHWTLVLCFGAMWGSLATYFKKKGEPVRWYNWLICGLAYCLAFLPYVIAMGLWEGLGYRVACLPIAVMLWCVLIGNDVVEEFGRYALVALTIPLMFIKRKGK